MLNIRSAVTSVAITLLLLSACAPVELKQALKNQRPRVSLADQRITHLDFNGIALAFGLSVDNPNPIGIQLAGLDYDLKLDGNPFLAGKQAQRMSIAAAGNSRVELPLSFTFSELRRSLRQLGDKAEVPYELVTGLMIEVPLLGTLRYPVTTRGTLPVPHMPSVSLQKVKLQRLDFSGATMELQLALDNPNAFGIDLNALNYDFTVNGKHWASGKRNNLGAVKKGAKGTITLPLSLNFMELGSGIYKLVSGGGALDYQLNGSLNARSDQRLLGAFDLPIKSSGRINLER